MFKSHENCMASRPLIIILLLTCSVLINNVEARSKERERDRDGGRRRDHMPVSASYTSSSALSVGAGVQTTYGAASQYNSYGSASGYVAPIPVALDNTSLCARRRDMKLMCYCTPDDKKVDVQKAECWVFSDSLYQNDTTWTRFYSQTKLRDLKFVVQNHGRLDFIPTNILRHLHNLTTITIEYSQVELIKSYAFANLPLLDRIVINNNQIMALDQEAFANHGRLRDLNLEHNQIFEIDRSAFRNLPMCERILLNNNNISSLHDGLFTDLVRLLYLNLASNQLSVLSSEMFKGLGNLNVLILTNNNLNFIGDTVFAELWSLTELNLDDNKIERISERALDGLNNLRTLNLRNNLLKKIDNGLLRGTPALLSLNVQQNHLETLTFYSFQPIMDNLVNGSGELLVNDNNIICDCRLQWLFEMKNRSQNHFLQETISDLVCTLQEPHLHNFVEPVPTHILDLLNIGGLGVTGGGNKKRFSNKRQGNGQRRNNGNKFNNGQLQMMTSGEEREIIQANSAALKKKRSLAHTAQYQGMGDDAVTDPMKHKPIESHYIFGGSETSSSSSSGIGSSSSIGLGAGLNMDYFDANGEQYQLLKQNVLYQQNNDILSTSTHEQNGLDVNLLPKHNVGGIRVRLLLLKPDRLPCHEDVNDPTELPLSRDLMDARSSNAQLSTPTNATATALHQAASTLLLMSMALVYGTQVG